MEWYEIAKVVHFLGLIALFGFFVLQSRVGGKLRAAGSVAEVREWLGLLEATRGTLPGAGVMFIASGLAMAGMRWRGNYPFVTVGLVTLLLIWIVGAIVSGRHLRAMRGAVSRAAEGVVPVEVAHVILDPARWGTIATLNGAALGVLFVMTTKIGWLGSVATVLGLAGLVGTLFTLAVRRQRARIGSTQMGVAA